MKVPNKEPVKLEIDEALDAQIWKLSLILIKMSTFLIKAHPDITSSLEVHKIFKIWNVQKPDIFLPKLRTLKNWKKKKSFFLCLFSLLWH